MVRSARDRFDRIGKELAGIDAEDLREAALEEPGEKILRSLRWSDAWLPDYERRLAEDPAFAAAEDDRAIRKADLHVRRRAMRRGRG